MMDDPIGLEQIKQKLMSYTKIEIKFNDPHFTQQLLLRAGTKKEVIETLLNPVQLVHFSTEEGKQGDTKYALYFKISKNRTMKIPVIFNQKGKKCLYILTYIMRYRSWRK